jgi:nucleoporin SEH1
LTTWSLAEEVDVQTLPSLSPSSMSHSQTVALATPTQTTAVLEGAPASLVAQALQQSQVGAPGGTAQARPGLGNREADGGWCLSWCKERYWGEVIAIGCGISGNVKVALPLLPQLIH